MRNKKKLQTIKKVVKLIYIKVTRYKVKVKKKSGTLLQKNNKIIT